MHDVTSTAHVILEILPTHIIAQVANKHALAAPAAAAAASAAATSESSSATAAATTTAAAAAAATTTVTRPAIFADKYVTPA